MVWHRFASEHMVVNVSQFMCERVDGEVIVLVFWIDKWSYQRGVVDNVTLVLTVPEAPVRPWQSPLQTRQKWA